MSHGNNTYPTYNYMENYHLYPPKYNREECGSLGIVSGTMTKLPTSLSCGSQRANRGRQQFTYVDNLLQDTGLENISELQTVMMDRGCWKGCVYNAGRLDDLGEVRCLECIICIYGINLLVAYIVYSFFYFINILYLV